MTWQFTGGGAVAWAYKGGEAHMQIDGYFYQNEGRYRVIDTSDVSSLSVSNADTVDGYHASSLWRSDGATWNEGANIGLFATKDGAEWSFDFQRGGHTSCKWQVWDSVNDSILVVDGATARVGIGVFDPTEKLDVAGNIKTSTSNGTYIQVGAIRLVYDSSNNAIKVIKSDGTNANLYATGGVSALGAGQESGGGGNYLPLSGGTLTGRTVVNWNAVDFGSAFYVQSTVYNQYGVGIGFGHSESNYNSAYLKFKSTTFNSGSSQNRLSIDLYGNDDILNVLGNGNVGIGTTNPQTKLEISGSLSSTAWVSDTAQFRVNASGTYYFVGLGVTNNGYGVIQGGHSGVGAIDLLLNPSAGNVGIGTTPSYKLHVSGEVGATGFTNTSDIRTKNIIKDVTLRLDQIAKAPTFEYYWLDTSIDHDLHVGTSAQYWESVLPQVVSTANDKFGTKAMQYGVAALISAITIARKVMTHEEEIALLKTRVSALEKENGEQELLINSLQEELEKYKAA